MDYQDWPAVTQLILQETPCEWTLSNDIGQNALTIMNIIKNGYSTYSYLIHNNELVLVCCRTLWLFLAFCPIILEDGRDL